MPDKRHFCSNLEGLSVLPFRFSAAATERVYGGPLFLSKGCFAVLRVSANVAKDSVAVSLFLPPLWPPSDQTLAGIICRCDRQIGSTCRARTGERGSLRTVLLDETPSAGGIVAQRRDLDNRIWADVALLRTSREMSVRTLFTADAAQLWKETGERLEYSPTKYPH